MSVLREPIARCWVCHFLPHGFVPRLVQARTPDLAELWHTTPVKACISWPYGLQLFLVRYQPLPDTASLRSFELRCRIYGKIHLSNSCFLGVLPEYWPRSYSAKTRQTICIIIIDTSSLRLNRNSKLICSYTYCIMQPSQMGKILFCHTTHLITV